MHKKMIFNTSLVHSFYIHWPFCPYRCHFCPFVALAGQDQYMQVYHDALIKEVTLFIENQLGEKKRLDTLFFGGGTPSTYPTNLLLDTLSILKESFDFYEQTEITIEVNPGTVQEMQVSMWAKAGINRLSVGVQSLKDGALHNLNRLQSKKDVEHLMSYVAYYIDNVSVDLIMGIPEVSFDEWKAYVQEVVQWPIKHISVYFLTVHEDTRLYFNVASGKVVLPSDDFMVTCYFWTQSFLAAEGFEQYELSNFAKKGYISRHNSVYWDRKPYKAFGLGACSFDGMSRMQNEKNLMKYIEKATKSESLVVEYEQLTPQQIRLEKAMLGLRRAKGALWNDICADLDEKGVTALRTQIDTLVCEGLMAYDRDGVRLTQKGLVVENQIIMRLGL
ncbi:MAG TPA: radical SAM family heme chaperone HemW [Patescibacteria group bacterium]|jgi:oxygen-independent coproporphyrinogen-3 oxidase|nr:radical SAM family heme chaperone HemW [Patescibacteria group bacterium]